MGQHDRRNSSYSSITFFSRGEPRAAPTTLKSLIRDIIEHMVDEKFPVREDPYENATIQTKKARILSLRRSIEKMAYQEQAMRLLQDMELAEEKKRKLISLMKTEIEAIKALEKALESSSPELKQSITEELQLENRITILRQQLPPDPYDKALLEGTLRDLNASQEVEGPHMVKVAGRDFIVNKNVFSPKFFRDTELFAEHLPIKPGEEMCEVGFGTGAVSITAVYRGASHVVGFDINPDAVRIGNENVKLHGMEDKIEFRQGGLFSLHIEEKFDIFFWNVPFAHVSTEKLEGRKLTDLERAVVDQDYKEIERYISWAPQYLKEGGRVYIGFSSTLGPIDMLQAFASQYRYDFKIVFEAKSEEGGNPVKYEIIELTPRGKLGNIR